VHLGSGNYLQRYKTYVTHVLQWRQQFDKLESVDLRYDGQIIVNPDLDGMTHLPALTPAAAKAAMAAGVKSAAIVNYEKYVAPPAPKSAASTATKKDAKMKAAAKPKPPVHTAAVHHLPSRHPAVKEATAKPASPKPASPKPVPVKPPSANQVATKAALKTKWKPAPVVASAHVAATHPVTVTAASGQKKPSAVIPKETPQR
jgi:hypothetical protein